MITPLIKNSCPEQWEGMTPSGQGRFCVKCSKIVIDFTKKTTQEIVDFLNARKGEDICGKLRTNPLPVRVKPGVRIFTAALYLVFGSLLFTSCGSNGDEQPVGKVALDSAEAAENQKHLDSIMQADSISRSQVQEDTTQLDSAEIMSTINILDSLMEAKNK